MNWVSLAAAIYLATGIVVLIFKHGEIIDEQIGEHYEQRGEKKFKVFLGIILFAVIFLWPSMLRAERNIQAKRIYVTKQVMEKFKGVAEERGEQIDGNTMITITLKFIKIYESMGRLMYKEHLKYELGKYRNEGLRDDYQGRTNL